MAGEFGDLVGLDFSAGDTGGGFASLSDAIRSGGAVPYADISTPSVPTTQVEPPSAGGGFSFSDLAKGAKDAPGTIGEFAKPILPFAQLGTVGVGMAGTIRGAETAAQQARIARQAQRMQGDVLRSQQAAAAPLTQFGSESLERAGQGQIPPAIQAKIDAWLTGAKAKARDFAARSGQGDSTMLTQWESWLDQQAQAMAADYLQSQQQLGIGALQAGAGALGGAAGTATQIQQGAAMQGGGIEKLMEEANKALAALSAGAA